MNKTLSKKFSYNEFFLQIKTTKDTNENLPLHSPGSCSKPADLASSTVNGCLTKLLALNGFKPHVVLNEFHSGPPRPPKNNPQT